MGGENCFTSTWQWSREGMLIHSWGSSNVLPPRGLSLVLSSKPGPRMSQGKGALSISRGNLGHFFFQKANLPVSSWKMFTTFELLR